jgi:glycosyltransferase involved in cell wall biosynthesis
MAMVGRLPHEEFAVALRACDVFISVPSVDATAVSLLEAMATGCGIIISSLPSSMEWVADGRSALVVAPRDVEGLAGAMLRYASDPEFLASSGKEALASAHRWAGFETNMAYVAAVFDALAGNGSWPAEVSLASLEGGAP